MNTKSITPILVALFGVLGCDGSRSTGQIEKTPGNVAVVPVTQNTSETGRSATRKIDLESVRFDVPKDWEDWPAAQQGALLKSYESSVHEIYRRYNQTALPANIVTLKALKSPNGQLNLIVVLMQLPHTDGLFAQLRDEAADKAKWGIQQGFITHASRTSPIDKLGFEGFYLTVSQADQSCVALAGLMHNQHLGQMLNLQLMASKDSHWTEAQAEKHLAEIVESLTIK
jgi:hypothetical protein